MAMFFDDNATYLFKDVTVEEHPHKKGRYKLSQNSSYGGMLAATRESGDAGIYVVPMSDQPARGHSDSRTRHAAAFSTRNTRSKAQAKYPILTKAERDKATAVPMKSEIIFEEDVEMPSRNIFNQL